MSSAAAASPSATTPAPSGFGVRQVPDASIPAGAKISSSPPSGQRTQHERRICPSRILSLSWARRLIESTSVLSCLHLLAAIAAVLTVAALFTSRPC